MEIPLIDCDQNRRSEAEIIADLDHAFRDVGFLAVRNLGLSEALRDRCFATSRTFFALEPEVKERSAYGRAAENFGFQGFGSERLDPGRPVDLKESFTMRNVTAVPLHDRRWPATAFARDMHEFYRHAMQAAGRLQRWLAVALGLDEHFFAACHSGENVTLRLLHYPPVSAAEIAAEQQGAGEHTDYGMLTLLLQDGVGGLEVRDSMGRWHAVPPRPDTVVINCGDLLERWTNGRYRSTPHRVRPLRHGQHRYSIALFVDPDSTTRIEALASCLVPDREPRFPPTTAGEHLQARIEATH